jgi:hypothetical protein
MGVNHFGLVYLTLLLLDVMKETAAKKPPPPTVRMVWVTSLGSQLVNPPVIGGDTKAKGIDIMPWDDLKCVDLVMLIILSLSCSRLIESYRYLTSCPEAEWIAAASFFCSFPFLVCVCFTSTCSYKVYMDGVKCSTSTIPPPTPSLSLSLCPPPPPNPPSPSLPFAPLALPSLPPPAHLTIHRAAQV